jgi:serine/threonine protein kinase
LKREVNTLMKLQGSAGVARLHDCYEGEEMVYLVTEFCSGGDLQRLSELIGTFSERSLALIAVEVFKTIQDVHDRGYVYGDIKPANFVIKNDMQHPICAAGSSARSQANLNRMGPWLKAVDFGCSQVLPLGRLTKRAGTPAYMAPEVFNRSYSVEADVWSAGIMLYQLFSGRFPYWNQEKAARITELAEVQAAVEFADMPMDYGPWLGMSAEGTNFMKSCLQRSSLDRIKTEDVMSHPWIQMWASDIHPDPTFTPFAAPSNNIVKIPNSIIFPRTPLVSR